MTCPTHLGRATTIEIFDTLSIPGVTVANRPGIHQIQTRSGSIQIAALPWVRRSALLSREDTRNLDFNQINERLQQALTGIIAELADKLDPSFPSILAAHVWVLNASVGSEKSMSIGQEHMLLLSSVALPDFDYVALGHIHKRQILNQRPPVVYSGSLERLDFGDENDEKGFYLIEVDNMPVNGGERKVSFDFHPIDARRFFSLHVDIEPQDADPTSTILEAIELNQNKIRDAVTRIDINLPDALSNKLRETEIRHKVKDAYYISISKDIQRQVRLRLGKGLLEGITPEDALKSYLESKYPSERAKLLLEYGAKLIQENARRE